MTSSCSTLFQVLYCWEEEKMQSWMEEKIAVSSGYVNTECTQRKDENENNINLLLWDEYKKKISLKNYSKRSSGPSCTGTYLHQFPLLSLITSWSMSITFQLVNWSVPIKGDIFYKQDGAFSLIRLNHVNSKIPCTHTYGMHTWYF